MYCLVYLERIIRGKQGDCVVYIIVIQYVLRYLIKDSAALPRLCVLCKFSPRTGDPSDGSAYIP